MTSVAEDLLVLAAAVGDLSARRPSDAVVAAAELADLALRGRVGVGDGRAMVADATPTGDPDLDARLAELGRARRPPKLERWVSRSRHRARDYRARAERGGAVIAERDRLLGLVPRARWAVGDTRRAAAVLARVRAAVAGDAAVTDADRSLAALAHAADLGRSLYPGREGAQARRALQDLMRADPSAHAAVRAAQAAAAAAAAGATVAATTAATNG
jgi:hypothetical protein